MSDSGSDNLRAKTQFREPWFLSKDNDLEEWVITDGVEFFEIRHASQAEIGLAVEGTVERRVAEAKAEGLRGAGREVERIRGGYNRTGSIHAVLTKVIMSIAALASGQEGGND